MHSSARKTSTAVIAAALLAAGTCIVVPSRAQEPYLGAIDFVGFNFAPRGWATCDGQLLPISANTALFSLLGTSFGGDGRITFALPDMRGRSPVHDGGSAGPGLTRRILGSSGGAESVTLLPAAVPFHTHRLMATASAGNQVLPTDHAFAQDGTDEIYRNEAPNTTMQAGAIGATPSGAHENMAPYLVVNCVIALQGIFPSRN